MAFIIEVCECCMMLIENTVPENGLENICVCDKRVFIVS